MSVVFVCTHVEFMLYEGVALAVFQLIKRNCFLVAGQHQTTNKVTNKVDTFAIQETKTR